MGWGGGTEIFDAVAEAISNLNISSPCHSEEDLLREVLCPLLEVLEDQDWDNMQESSYYDHPIIGKILGNAFEEEDEDSDEEWDWFFDERDE